MKKYNYVLNQKQQQQLQRRGIYGNYQYSLFPKPIGSGPFNRYPFYGNAPKAPRSAERTKYNGGPRSGPQRSAEPRPYKIKK